MKGIELQNSIPTVNAISNFGVVAILAIFLPKNTNFKNDHRDFVNGSN